MKNRDETEDEFNRLVHIAFLAGEEMQANPESEELEYAWQLAVHNVDECQKARMRIHMLDRVGRDYTS